MRRSKVPYKKAKRMFTKSAGPRSSHPRNGMGGLPMMRGGIRL